MATHVMLIVDVDCTLAVYDKENGALPLQA